MASPALVGRLGDVAEPSMKTAAFFEARLRERIASRETATATPAGPGVLFFNGPRPILIAAPAAEVAQLVNVPKPVLRERPNVVTRSSRWGRGLQVPTFALPESRPTVATPGGCGGACQKNPIQAQGPDAGLARPILLNRQAAVETANVVTEDDQARNSRLALLGVAAVVVGLFFMGN